MEHKILDKTLEVCQRIENDRTISGVFDHAKSEMDELSEEILRFLDDQEPGPDGVVGEAIDVIICMVDIIYKKNPSISKEQIYFLICQKLDKWERLYGNKKGN